MRKGKVVASSSVYQRSTMCELSPWTILIVDDEEDVLQLVSIVLREDGYSVVKARNGREALDLFPGVIPDLVLLDVRMPGMNGPQFISEYRAMVDQAAPVVLMTASARPDEEAAKIGAIGWIEKPFDLDTLSETVKQHLENIKKP